MKKRKLTSEELSPLCLELSLLLHAGLPVGDGLHALADETRGETRELLDAMAKDADGGAKLSDVLRRSGAFPDYATDLTACGEQTGRTEEALSALADYYDARRRLELRIRSALLYPAVLLLLMLVVIVVLLTKVLPVFNDVFASLGGELTGLAGGLLSLGTALDRAMPFLAALLAAAAVFLALFAGSDEFRARLLRLRRRRHGDRGLSRKVNTARFAQALSMGLRSGLTAEAAVELAASFKTENEAADARCRACLTQLQSGAGLAEALEKNGCLPGMYCRMLALGVRSGTADSVTEEIARRLSEESENAIEERVGAVEPALVIVTSLLVGMILLSVMLPLMNIMAAIG